MSYLVVYIQPLESPSSKQTSRKVRREKNPPHHKISITNFVINNHVYKNKNNSKKRQEEKSKQIHVICCFFFIFLGENSACGFCVMQLMIIIQRVRRETCVCMWHACMCIETYISVHVRTCEPKESHVYKRTQASTWTNARTQHKFIHMHG